MLRQPDALCASCEKLLEQVAQCRPELNEREGRKVGHQLLVCGGWRSGAFASGWGFPQVITIGCFDLFHRGHENLLRMLREFGTFVVVGIHDDASYLQVGRWPGFGWPESSYPV